MEKGPAQKQQEEAIKHFYSVLLISVIVFILLIALMTALKLTAYIIKMALWILINFIPIALVVGTMYLIWHYAQRDKKDSIQAEDHFAQRDALKKKITEATIIEDRKG